ncbi:hypothetical protein V8G54_037034 [Vigna mungo]|uniref:Fungal lipase-type domain-containing protein n=1 Tax=Vigna mungo TaxID=3915 RepID=A0AAQ3MII6_VIGMU
MLLPNPNPLFLFLFNVEVLAFVKLIIGIEEKIANVKLLIHKDPKDTSFNGIWGMVGIIKTTLAEQISLLIESPRTRSRSLPSRPARDSPSPSRRPEPCLQLSAPPSRGPKCYLSFSAREQVPSEVKRLLNYYKDKEISIIVTGHSLGAALAVLSAYNIAEVGNLKFKEQCEELGVKVLRVVNVHDVVPTVSGIITNEKFQFQKYIKDALSFPWSYAHVGMEIALD